MNQPKIHDDVPLLRDQLDDDAVGIIERLRHHGEEAMLVGGCIRDLIRGKQPKDFDVITSATPQQLRRWFRNSRLIGRRFKLIHVYWGEKIIEVTTFRAPERGASDPRVGAGEANYGDARSDALLRDFSINALYYDPLQRRLIDYVGGYPDLRRGVLRAIGDPVQRVLEDPVRILRGVRYAASVDLDVDPATEDAFIEHAGLIDGINASRLREEVWKFLKAPGTAEAFELLLDYDLFDRVLPGLRRWIEPAGCLIADFEEKDRLPVERQDQALLWAILFLGAFDEMEALGRSSLEREIAQIGRIVDDLLEPLAIKHNIARRERFLARHLLEALPRLLRGPARQRRLAAQPWLPTALDLYELYCRSRNQPLDQLSAWQLERVAVLRDESVQTDGPAPARRRRRRRRRPDA
jgi:poly(A) polymerase